MIVWPPDRLPATPGTVACQNQHQLARLAEPQVAVQAIHWRHLGPPTTCPAMPGVITGHYGLGPVRRAGRNKPSGHLYYWGWPLIPSGFGQLSGARVRLPRSCQPIPSRTFSIDLLLKRSLTSSSTSKGTLFLDTHTVVGNNSLVPDNHNLLINFQIWIY